MRYDLTPTWYEQERERLQLEREREFSEVPAGMPEQPEPARVQEWDFLQVPRGVSEESPRLYSRGTGDFRFCSAIPGGIPSHYTIAGERFRLYTVTPEDLEYWGTLERGDVGKFYIVITGCLQFVDPEGVTDEL